MPAVVYRPRAFERHACDSLDEATAFLDVDNETEIQEAITHLVRGKNVFIITTVPNSSVYRLLGIPFGVIDSPIC